MGVFMLCVGIALLIGLPLLSAVLAGLPLGQVGEFSLVATQAALLELNGAIVRQGTEDGEPIRYGDATHALRVDPHSPLVGSTIAGCGLRPEHGVTVLTGSPGGRRGTSCS